MNKPERHDYFTTTTGPNQQVYRVAEVLNPDMVRAEYWDPNRGWASAGTAPTCYMNPATDAQAEACGTPPF